MDSIMRGSADAPKRKLFEDDDLFGTQYYKNFDAQVKELDPRLMQLCAKIEASKATEFDPTNPDHQEVHQILQRIDRLSEAYLEAEYARCIEQGKAHLVLHLSLYSPKVLLTQEFLDIHLKSLGKPNRLTPREGQDANTPEAEILLSKHAATIFHAPAIVSALQARSGIPPAQPSNIMPPPKYNLSGDYQFSNPDNERSPTFYRYEMLPGVAYNTPIKPKGWVDGRTWERNINPFLLKHYKDHGMSELDAKSKSVNKPSFSAIEFPFDA